ncbi:ABC transporter ATP-binding protein [Serpentinicella alkaliphila]|uniref:Putative ABC transport system ATP-binding protein n=1 Tax=Serpentinicella alkaliphila TaxID=1734049 RepID=A0A4R2T7X3_9FIRM|nr:ABC transporter ATP-binding protein [Serpentinicella alkaliphila]QUH24490.1 ABC transporter ATP-binding protein [Serpentinicella alkaliphila]TCP96964.1 putative ABC transport system ATP-binding protein [Serpentinicella alkaliphila]
MIEAKNLIKTYGEGNTEVNALNGINLSVKKGEFVSIQGPSGCGKSTLLNIISCLEKPTNGKIIIDNIDIADQDDDKLAEIRRDKIGFIFQSYNLIPTMSALENVMLPMMFAGKDDKIMTARATMLLEMVGMQNRMNHKPAELSGGEQQRVAVARALINDPLLIIGDEPTGNLDSKTGSAVMEMLVKLNKEGRTILIVTHDSVVANMADRVMHIKDGQFIDNQSGQEA